MKQRSKVAILGLVATGFAGCSASDDSTNEAKAGSAGDAAAGTVSASGSGGSAGTKAEGGGASMGGSAVVAGSGGAGVTAGAGGTAGAGHERPNVIVIMVDDLGYSDLGSYGSEIKTPNIDALATDGVRFTNFYNASRCSPTRASLLTGQYAHRVNQARNGRSLGTTGVTIAEVLGSAGYATAMAGKWHLSVAEELPDPEQHLKWLNHQIFPDRDFAPLESYPARRGFEQHFGIIWGVVNHWDPFSLVDGTKPVTPEAGFLMDDAVSAKAAQYIEGFAEQDKPFFMYVAYTGPHWPLHARPADIAKYDGVYDVGWDQIREARFQKQLAAGLFAAQNTKLPASSANDWAALSDVQRTFLANAMQTHAAMIDEVDQGVGKIVAALEQAGKLESTLLLIMSDNGASSEISTQPGYDRPSQTRDGKPIVYCGGQAACPYAQPGPETTYAAIGPSWANVANTPFREFKKDSFRGGVSTPFIVHWPAGLALQAGSINAAPGHVIDVLPTILEATGVPYPATYAGHAINSLDGSSLLPLLQDKPWQGHEHLFFEHENGAALIEGDFKLVRFGSPGAAWELYDLSRDRTETTNLAASSSARVNAMKATWQTWFDSMPK